MTALHSNRMERELMYEVMNIVSVYYFFFQFGQRPIMAMSLRKVADFCHRHLNTAVVTCPVSICECICINHPPHHNSESGGSVVIILFEL